MRALPCRPVERIIGRVSDSVYRSVATLLAVNRTVGIVLVSMLFFGLGEQLWSPFFPSYLEARIKPDPAHTVAGVALSALLAVGLYWWPRSSRAGATGSSASS